MKNLKVNLLLIGFVITLFSTAMVANANDQSSSDAGRIFMLEKALAPQSAEATAKLFAEANKNRNAALQFMLFSNYLKNEYQNGWQPNWISGQSSPWITGYTIKKTAEGTNVTQYTITYQLATAEGAFEPSLTQVILVQTVPTEMNSSQQFYITKFNESNN